MTGIATSIFPVLQVLTELTTATTPRSLPDQFDPTQNNKNNNDKLKRQRMARG